VDSFEDKTHQDPGGKDVDSCMEEVQDAVKPMEVVPVQICHTTFVILICNYHHTSAVFFAIQPAASSLSFLFAFTPYIRVDDLTGHHADRISGG
jgi:hypothetical protein